MKEKDRETSVGQNRFYLGDDNIIYFTLVGEHEEKRALACKGAFLKLVGVAEGKVNALGDLTGIRKQSPEARAVWKELNEHEKVGKIALIGLNPVARVIASFVMGISNKKDLRLFGSRNEALGWLKKK